MRTKLKGYQSRDPISHRRYSRTTSLNRMRRTGKYNYVGTMVRGKMIYGLGHKAGEMWGAAKRIDPESKATKYSKNSPSFDEGVHNYKISAKGKALSAFK